mgnify:CR=1 FL=1
MGLDKDKNGKFVVSYQYSKDLAFHKLLTQKRIKQSFLCSILGVSQKSSAIRLINQPFKLSLQQLINLSFCLDVSLISLIDIIKDDFIKCATSFNPELRSLVPKHVKDLNSSAEWFER